jgi:hypothetical protein
VVDGERDAHHAPKKTNIQLAPCHRPARTNVTITGRPYARTKLTNRLLFWAAALRFWLTEIGMNR